MNVVVSVINSRPVFMNTRLFFNPANEDQKIVGIEIRNITFLLSY